MATRRRLRTRPSSTTHAARMQAHPSPPELLAWMGRLPGAAGILSALGKTLAAALAPIVKRWPAAPRDPFGMDRAVMDWLRPFFEFLYHIYFRVEAKGVRNVPRRGRAILVANHAGGLPYDAVMIHLAIFHEPPHRLVRFLAENFVFQIPFLAELVTKAGAVRACHEDATALLEQEELVVVFPEGTKGVGKTYDDRYRLHRFGRGGFVRLAIRTKAPIIPVAVVGSEEIHPIIWRSEALARPLGLPFIPFTPTFPWLGPLGLVPLPSKWHLDFGRPIPFRHFGHAAADDDALVEREALRVWAAVEKMLQRRLEMRKSIWT